MKLSHAATLKRFSALSLVLFCLAARSSAAAEVDELDVSFPVTGAVNDMYDWTTASGLTFQVHLQNIQYDGQVRRALLERKSDDELTVWLALQDLEVTINHTQISGRRRSASCGPLTVVMGTRDEIWIAFDVKRDHTDGQRSLVVENTRFGFAEDNWSVGAPAWVSTSGFGMTQARVVSGLQGGLLNQRAEFERQITQVARPMFAEVEGHVQRHLQRELVSLQSSSPKN